MRIQFIAFQFLFSFLFPNMEKRLLSFPSFSEYRQQLQKVRKQLIYIAGMLFCLLSAPRSFAQCSVTSTDGYTVNISVRPARIDVPASCQNGYNYNVELKYTITFTGTNKPANLYTLQGNLGCSSDNLFFPLPTGSNDVTGTITTTTNPYRGSTDCSTATVSSMGCNSLTITIDGPGISQRTISCAIAPLPVSLLRFGAEARTAGVEVAWATASELNNKEFIVERSSDAQNWSAVHRQEGAGTSFRSAAYSWLDIAAPKATLYYRLKQTDFDGKHTYSSVVSTAPASGPAISVAPNPNHGNTIHLTGLPEAGRWELQVLSPAAKLLHCRLLTSSEVELPEIPAGIYFLHLRDLTTGQKTVLKYSRQ